MSKLQGAFIGFGNIAELGHWPTYAQSKDCEIVAIMDPSPLRQDAAKALKPSLRVYNRVEQLLEKEKLDFVDICTPPVSHAALALAALQRGCHVLCEKPLSLKPSEYEELARETVQRGKTVFTVHNWKYAPIFQKAFALIRDDRIGPVWHVDIFTLRDSHCKGTSIESPSPDLRSASPQGEATPLNSPLPRERVQGEGFSPQDWRKNPSIAGGGILVDHGWHSFYLLLNLVGGVAPESVLSKMLISKDDPNALEEATQTLIQFPEADGYIHLTWRSKMRRNSVVIQGLNGTLLIDDDRILLTTHAGEKEEIKFDAALSAGSHHADWFKALLPDFVEEIRNPTKRGANFREAGWCLALTKAAYESNMHGFKEIPVVFPGTLKQEPALA